MTVPAHTTLSAIARSDHAYYGAVGETHAFDWGVAHVCSELPGIPELNQLREVGCLPDEDVEGAIEAVDVLYAAHGSRCFRWSVRVGHPADAIEGPLCRHGFARVDSVAMRLSEWPQSSSEPATYRILPARPMREAFRSTFVGQLGVSAESLADAACERLNDTRLDLFVAMDEHDAMGRCGLHVIGDIGCVRDLFVLEPFRRRGVGTALLSHVLAIARRLTLNMVCVRCESSNEGGRSFLERHGFEADGALVEFHRA